MNRKLLIVLICISIFEVAFCKNETPNPSVLPCNLEDYSIFTSVISNISSDKIVTKNKLAPNPPTGPATQFFCEVDNPTISQLVASGSNILWYETALSNIPINPSVLLEDGEDYFATQTVAGSESINRLQVIVEINDPGIPTGDNVQTLCLSEYPIVGDLQAGGSSIQWYSTSTSTNALNPNVALVSGDDYYATQTSGGCESTNRLQVIVAIDDPAAPSGAMVQTFCEADNPTIQDLIASGSNIQWYVDATSTSPLLNFVTLEQGEDYYATQTINGCESNTRLQVIITLEDPPTPTSADLFPVYCQSESPTIGDLEVTGSNIQWYSSLASTSPLGLGVLLSNGEDYFATQTLNGCESTARLQIIVAFENPNTPTAPSSNNNLVSFCTIDNPTVGNLVAVGQDIQWYDELASPFPIDPIIPLVDGEDYFATQTLNGCESNGRLEINVIIYDTGSPTINNANQTFCSIDNLTIADLDILGTSILWYDDAASTIPLDITDLLLDGEDYYATQTLDGCESINREVVNVTIIAPSAPTTSSISQSFCSIDNPTIADIAAQGNNITWYDDMTSTTALSLSTVLLDGENYFATQTVNACESPSRLEVTVVIENPTAPTTSSTNQVFCVVDNPTLADISVTGSSITWYANATSNTILPSITSLIDGEDYFASQIINGCESDTRLQINVSLDDPLPPTTVNSTQSFCSSSSPTISDLSAIGTAIVWYENVSSDIPLPNNTTLIDGEDYFATQTLVGCESNNRLQIQVDITSTPDNALLVTPMDVAVCINEMTSIQIFNSEIDVSYQLINSATSLPVGTSVSGTGGIINLPTDILTSNSFFQIIATSTQNNNCLSTLISQATVVVDSYPTTAAAGLDKVVCNETTTNLEGNLPSIGSGTWSQISGPNSALITNPNANDSGISNLIAGTYIFQWEIDNGACNGSLASLDQVEIQVFDLSANTIPTAVSTVDGNDGILGICIENGTAPYTVLWTPDNVGILNQEISLTCNDYFEITNLPSGLYEIGIMDDNGCTLILSNQEMLEPDCSDFGITNIIPSHETCNENNDGSITIITENGLGDITMEIGNGISPVISNNPTYTFVDLEAGSYEITITDERLCAFTSSQEIIISEPDLLNAQINTTNTSAIGATDGVICIIPEGGTAPYSITASCGSVIQGTNTCGGDYFVENLGAGTCSIEITDANNCSYTVSGIVILEPFCDDFIIGSVISEDLLCNNDGSGIIEISVNNGIAPYEYSVDGGNSFTSDNSNTYIFDNLNAGSYNIVVMDAAGCSRSYSNEIEVDEPAILLVDLSNVSNDCFGTNEGQIVPAISGGSPDYSYIWSNGITAPTNSGLSSGAYTLTVTDVNGCTASSSATIINAPEFDIEIQVGGIPTTEININEGETVVIDIITDAINPMYEWSPVLGLSASNTASAIASPIVTTEYIVEVTSEDNCSLTNMIRVNVTTDYKIVIPNSFSPNGDSINDDFYPITEGIITINDFKIYNRWGQLIYDNNSIPWTGIYKGKEQPVDTYVYVITYETNDTPSTTVSGDILLVR